MTAITERGRTPGRRPEPAGLVWPVVLLLLVVGLGTAPAHGPEDSRAKFDEAQALLQRGAYREAVHLLEEVEREHPYGEVVAHALHWRAFALWKLGDREELRRAVDVLEQMVDDHPDAAVKRDTAALCDRVAAALHEHDDPWTAERAVELGLRIREHAEAGSSAASPE